MANTLQAKIQLRLDKAPHGRALAFVDSQGRFAWQSFEQVYRRASVYGRTLVGLGLGPGDVCVLILPSQQFCATLLLATLICGGVPVLVAPPSLQGGSHSSLLEIVKSILKRMPVRMVVCHESLQANRDELESGNPNTVIIFGDAVFRTAVDDSPLPAIFPSEIDTAALQLTSGTTDVPRICRWQQRQILAALDGMALAMALTPDDICVNWTPLYHDMGLVNNFLLCMAHGTPLVMLNPTDFVKRPALWLQALSNTSATVTWSPNFGYAIATQRVKNSEIEHIRLDNVRTFWNAAEKIHLQTILDFHRRFATFGVRSEALKMNFGCAENIGGATFTNLNTPFVCERVYADVLQEQRIAQPVLESDRGKPEITLTGVGRPHPNLRVVIAGDDGSVLPDGHIGEILLETPSRMTEYVGQPEETLEALRGALLRTGDLGYLRDGELFWVGRARERITIRGRKIDPSEFETILWNISGLRPGCFAAFGVEQVDQGTERIVLVAEVNEADPPSYSKIAEAIHEQVILQIGVSVNDVLLVEKGMLTKTSSGKRRHRHFRDLYLKNEVEFVYRSRGRATDALNCEK